MKQEEEGEVDTGERWRMPETALGKPRDTNTRVLERSLVRQQDPFLLLFHAHVQSLCAGEIVLNVLVTGSFWQR